MKYDIDQFYQQRKAVAATMTKLWNTRLTSTSGGNISLRINNDLFCITPSSKDKSSLQAEDIAVVTMEGENLTPQFRLSIESEMHRLILLARPEINAVVHAHPAFGSLLSTTDLRVNSHLSGEAYYVLGEPAFTSYARQGSPELAAKVSQAAKDGARVIVMENHGVTALGKDLVQAFDRIEVLENTARMTVFTNLLAKNGVKIHELPLEECLAL